MSMSMLSGSVAPAGDAPPEFATEGESRIEEFARRLPCICVGGVDRFQLLGSEATCVFGTVALEGARVKVAVAGVFDEAVFDPVIVVAFVEDGVVEEFQLFRRQRVLWCHHPRTPQCWII